MKRMDTRYFYVGDHIQNKTLSLQHCPTDEMLADYFTKPLKGSLFIRLCNPIMGAESEDRDPQAPRSVLEYQDHHENQEASKRDQKASERDQKASERDQNERENNNKKLTPRDKNHENACVTNTDHDKHTRK